MCKLENSKKLKSYKTVLSIAGSDSIGGAGVQADIKTCTALGVYAMTAVTAVTAQNSLGVECYESVSDKLLRAQLNAVISDVTPDAVKIGMLPTTKSVEIVAEFITKHNINNVVLDTICISTSGHPLTLSDVPSAIAEKLFPVATIITPNIPEAQIFLGKDIAESAAEQRGLELVEKYQLNSLLLKGGHFDGKRCIDRLFLSENTKIETFIHDRISTINTHGTGCSLSSAVASYLALGYNLTDSVKNATSWIANAIREGACYKFGHGHGPINHMFNIIK